MKARLKRESPAWLDTLIGGIVIVTVAVAIGLIASVVGFTKLIVKALGT